MNTRRRSQSGNIFFALFGAVGLIGVLGAASMTILKGPVRSMAEVTKRTVAENAMIAAGRLSLSAATQAANGGDCDGDGYIEPVEWNTTGTGIAPAGGGFIPASIGAAQQDPWGTTYGYCAWDHGSAVDAAGCGGATQKRLDGEESEDYAAIAVISSGANRTFETSCNDTPDYLTRVSGSDDIILEYTYGESSAMGLWRLKSGDPDTAEIGARNIEVAGSGGAGAARIGYDADLDMAGVGDFLAIKTDHVYAQTDGGDVTFHNLLKVASIESLGAPVAGGIAQDADEFDDMIAAFAGACPDGWTEVTALHDRVIIGAGTTYSVGDTGGAATVTLTSAELPSHAHSVDPPAHTHSVDPPNTGTTTTGAHTHSIPEGQVPGGGGSTYASGDDMTGGVAAYSTSGSAGDHNHAVDIGAFTSGSTDIGAFNSSAAGSGAAHENRPPYRAYTYCSFDGDFSVYVSGDTLGGLSCSSGQIAKYNGSIWTCAADDSGGGGGSSVWLTSGSDAYYNDGNVGIGTSTPARQLHVEGASSQRIRIRGTDSSTYAGIELDANSRLWSIQNRGDLTGGFSIADETASAHRLVIDTSGNVGIGTASPSTLLHIKSASSAQLTLENGGTSSSQIVATGGDGNLNFLTSGSTRLRIMADGKIGIGISAPTASLHFGDGRDTADAIRIDRNDGVARQSSIGHDSSGAYIQVKDNGDTFSVREAGGTERLHVNVNTGRVGIGTNAPVQDLHISNTASAIRLQGSGGYFDLHADNGGSLFRIYEGSTRVFAITGNQVGIMNHSPSYTLHVSGSVAGNSAYVNISDLRLKKDVETIDYGLRTIEQLRPVSFYWKEQEKDWQLGRKLGLVAQEAEKIIPEIVTTAKDEMKTKSIAYGDVVPVLIKAVQELKTLFDELVEKVAQLFDTTAQHEKRIAALEENNRALEEQNRALELENRALRMRLDDIESALTQEAR